MEQNEELRVAWDFVEHTDISIFLTGKAGTGKTTFLKAVREHSSKRMIVVAPTGVAAINAGGVTIHSFFQLPLSPFIPGTNIKDRYDFGKEKRRIIRTLDLLIIDEISMVRSDLLDAIDYTLRKYRHPGKPFGGVQLLMIGDLQQLTPVVTNEDAHMLDGHYTTPYFFGSHALQEIEYVTIGLQKVYRQQDVNFITLLNHIRDNHLSAEDIAKLNERWNPNFRPASGSDYIRLTTHNHLADTYNDNELRRLTTKSFTYRADIDGTFPEYTYPTSEVLTLKVGAQVMFVKNDAGADHLYYNGRIGHVTYADASTVNVLCPGDEKAIEVMPQEWENAKYKINEKTREIETEVQGTFRQLPLRLAWSITIHKSQGLTFQHAIIDAGASFAPGQVYVALSRCKTFEGMVLATRIEPRAILSDQRVNDYISHQEEDATLSIERLPDIKEEYYRNLLVELFTFTDIGQAEERLCRLMIEHFQHAFPAITTMHKQCSQDMQQRIILVAYKWDNMLRAMTPEQLHSKELLQRVERSAVYFHDALKEIFETLLVKTQGVKNDNKQLMRRFGDVLTELQQACGIKFRLLGDIAESGFTISNYMNMKQRAVFDTAEEQEPLGGPKRDRKSKQKSEKEKKENTHAITLRMFLQGMSREQIAKERNLSVGTISTHLALFVRSGQIDLQDIVPADNLKSILRALRLVGADQGLQAIKTLCPATISFDDIRLVINSRK